MPLRPDIALAISTGPNAGLHLFDAKFWLDRPDTLLPIADEETDDERQHEQRGTFKRADLYKMHTYRDAIPEARTVWILYPVSRIMVICRAVDRVYLPFRSWSTGASSRGTPWPKGAGTSWRLRPGRCCGR